MRHPWGGGAVSNGEIGHYHYIVVFINNMQPTRMNVRSTIMKNEQMLKSSYETYVPAGDQIDCYLS